MVVYCPPIEKVSCLFHLVCILHTQNILLDDILHLRPRRPRRRYIPQCTHYPFLVKLLQQKEPHYRVHIHAMKQFMTQSYNIYACYTSALYYLS